MRSPCARQKSRTARSTSRPDPARAGRSLEGQTSVCGRPLAVMAGPFARFGVTTALATAPSPPWACASLASPAVAQDSTRARHTRLRAVAVLSSGNGSR